MAIADVEKPALAAHREIKDRAGRDVGQIHVAAMIIRLQRRDRLDLGRDADGADERLVGQRDLVAPAHAVLVDMHFPDPLRQRRIEHGGRRGPNQAAKFRNDAGGAGRLRAAGLHRMNDDGEAVALLNTAYRDRPALRVQERKPQFRGRTILFAGDDAAERILGLDHDDIARVDGQHGLGVRPVDIMKRPLRFDGEFMALAGLSFGAVNSAVFFLFPGWEARMATFLSRFRLGLATPLPPTHFLPFILIPAAVGVGLPLWFLIARRDAFQARDLSREA